MAVSKNILLMMSGSIACAKATSLISEWVKAGHAVRVACTSSASEFVGRATLEGLSGQPVFDDTFETGCAMDHISLAQWAELIVVCPASANLINKFAAGIADDAVTTLWQAAFGRGMPQFIVPAMNTHMWNYPATREAVEKLRSWGVHVLPTSDGVLACGEQGAGRMLEPADILRSIDALLSFDQPIVRGRVLVTAGGTREPIDAVRYIGNQSTGRTSAHLVDAFVELGLDVTWLGARSAARPRSDCKQIEFETFVELERQLAQQLQTNHYDLVVHAAAVGDYSVREVADAQGATQTGQGKLTSGDELNLRLAPNPKLLNRIQRDSLNPQVKVVGFKLTVGANLEEAKRAVDRLFQSGGVGHVVHNDLKEIRAGRPSFTVYRQGSDEGPLHTGAFDNSEDLACALASLIVQDLRVKEIV